MISWKEKNNTELPARFWGWWDKLLETGGFGQSREILDLCQRLRNKYQFNTKFIQRPDWPEYFLKIALCVAERSVDNETKCGCVLCNSSNQIISTGYNSFPKGLPDGILPNMRPQKHETGLMKHAEISAIINCTVSPTSLPQPITAYISQRPCIQCLSCLADANVKTIYCLDVPNPSKLADFESDEYQLLLFSAQIMMIMVPVEKLNLTTKEM